eukprot:SAG11_NODE_1474_length_4839_cov_2.761603_4_plen_104_part_00
MSFSLCVEKAISRQYEKHGSSGHASPVSALIVSSSRVGTDTLGSILDILIGDTVYASVSIPGDGEALVSTSHGKFRSTVVCLFEMGRIWSSKSTSQAVVTCSS